MDKEPVRHVSWGGATGLLAVQYIGGYGCTSLNIKCFEVSRDYKALKLELLLLKSRLANDPRTFTHTQYPKVIKLSDCNHYSGYTHHFSFFSLAVSSSSSSLNLSFSE